MPVPQGVEVRVLSRAHRTSGRLAQWLEHRVYIAGVIGPNPMPSTQAAVAQWQSTALKKLGS